MGNAKVLNNRRPQGGLPSERGGDACWKFRIKRSIRPTGVPAKAFVCTCNCTKPFKTLKQERGKDWALTRVHLGLSSALSRVYPYFRLFQELFPSIVQRKQRDCELRIFSILLRLAFIIQFSSWLYFTEFSGSVCFLQVRALSSLLRACSFAICNLRL